ncbi:MAG: hypothetical protein NVSMB55_01110 [Mycobacteriales bacterium]
MPRPLSLSLTLTLTLRDDGRYTRPCVLEAFAYEVLQQLAEQGPVGRQGWQLICGDPVMR